VHPQLCVDVHPGREGDYVRVRAEGSGNESHKERIHKARTSCIKMIVSTTVGQCGCELSCKSKRKCQSERLNRQRGFIHGDQCYNTVANLIEEVPANVKTWTGRCGETRVEGRNRHHPETQQKFLQVTVVAGVSCALLDEQAWCFHDSEGADVGGQPINLRLGVAVQTRHHPAEGVVECTVSSPK
jgi:hypothetical protein